MLYREPMMSWYCFLSLLDLLCKRLLLLVFEVFR